MDIRTIGDLRTLALWEDLLDSLPEHAEGPEGLGRMWENEEPPRNAGQDPTIKQGWRLAIVRGVEFQIPRNVTERLEVPAEKSATGKPYTLIRIDRTAVHLHGVKVNDRKVRGDVHVCARVFWPKGADKRTNGGLTAWKNYLIFLDIYPTSLPGNAEYELEVFCEGAERSPVLMLGVDDVEERTGTHVLCWATRSANWKPARHGRYPAPSTGSDQLIAFYEVK